MRNHSLGQTTTARSQRAYTTLVPDEQRLDPAFDVFQQLTSQPKPWTVASLAEVTGFGLATIYKALQSGKLIGVKLGGSIRVPQRNALTWYNGLATA